MKFEKYVGKKRCIGGHKQKAVRIEKDRIVILSGIPELRGKRVAFFVDRDERAILMKEDKEGVMVNKTSGVTSARPLIRKLEIPKGQKKVEEYQGGYLFYY